MSQIRIAAVSAAMVLFGMTNLGPAFARPPTVGINPGYDRRLTESRNGQAGTDVTVAPNASTPAAHKKRRHPPSPKRQINSEAPQRATASRLVSTILRI